MSHTSRKLLGLSYAEDCITQRSLYLKYQIMYVLYKSLKFGFCEYFEDYKCITWINSFIFSTLIFFFHIHVFILLLWCTKWRPKWLLNISILKAHNYAVSECFWIHLLVIDFQMRESSLSNNLLFHFDKVLDFLSIWKCIHDYILKWFLKVLSS